VGRVASFSIVPACSREALQLAGLFTVRVDVHFRIVVPRVAPLLARRAKGELVLLQLLRFWISMCRRKLDLVAVRPEEAARGLADAGRDALGFAGGQIEYVNLIEGILRLALALKDHPLSVGRPVAFPGTSALDREAADACQKVAFLVLHSALYENE